MKIAGQKNDGAWFRSNQALMKLTTDQRDVLKATILTCPTLDAAFVDIQSLAVEVGATDNAFPETKADWVSRLMLYGIPRQIWNGKPTFTTYAKIARPGWVEGEPVKFLYKPNYSSNLHQFAKELRNAVRNFIRGSRQLRDVYNVGTAQEGNPGGWPNAEAPDDAGV